MIPKEQIAHDLAIAVITAKLSRQTQQPNYSFSHASDYKDLYKQYLKDV